MVLITEIWFIRMHIMSETLCVFPFRKRISTTTVVSKEQIFGGRMKASELKGSGYAAAEHLGPFFSERYLIYIYIRI